MLVDCDAAGREDLLRLLRRYRLRQKVDIADVSSDYRVWACFGGGSDGASAPAAAGPGWAPDPRLPQLGLRAVLPAGEGGGESGGGDWRAHRRWRIAHGVAEGDTEIPSGAPLLCRCWQGKAAGRGWLRVAAACCPGRGEQPAGTRLHGSLCSRVPLQPSWS